jgi:hypothetical protein
MPAPTPVEGLVEGREVGVGFHPVGDVHFVAGLQFAAAAVEDAGALNARRIRGVDDRVGGQGGVEHHPEAMRASEERQDLADRHRTAVRIDRQRIAHARLGTNGGGRLRVHRQVDRPGTDGLGARDEEVGADVRGVRHGHRRKRVERPSDGEARIVDVAAAVVVGDGHALPLGDRRAAKLNAQPAADGLRAKDVADHPVDHDREATDAAGRQQLARRTDGRLHQEKHRIGAVRRDARVGHEHVRRETLGVRDLEVVEVQHARAGVSGETDLADGRIGGEVGPDGGQRTAVRIGDRPDDGPAVNGEREGDRRPRRDREGLGQAPGVRRRPVGGLHEEDLSGEVETDLNGRRAARIDPGQAAEEQSNGLCLTDLEGARPDPRGQRVPGRQRLGAGHAGVERFDARALEDRDAVPHGPEGFSGRPPRVAEARVDVRSFEGVFEGRRGHPARDGPRRGRVQEADQLRPAAVEDPALAPGGVPHRDDVRR